MTYILTWRLPVALLIASLAVFPIMSASRSMRNGDRSMMDSGAVEEGFLTTLIICLAAGFFPPIAIGIVVIWTILYQKRLLSIRVVLASLIAVTLYLLYYALAVYLGWIDNVLINGYQ